MIFLKIPPGTTVKEMAVLCSEAEGVTIPAEAIFDAQCMVMNTPVDKDYIFTGEEKNITFFYVVGVGC